MQGMDCFAWKGGGRERERDKRGGDEMESMYPTGSRKKQEEERKGREKRKRKKGRKGDTRAKIYKVGKRNWQLKIR